MNSRRLSPPSTGRFFAALQLLSSKEIAASTGRSVDTAKSWREGKTQPSVTDLAALCDAHPALLAAFLEDRGMHRAALEVRDAELQRKQAELNIAWAQLGGRPERRSR